MKIFGMFSAKPGQLAQFTIVNEAAGKLGGGGSDVVTVKTDAEAKTFEVNGGVVEVLKNQVIILAE